MKKTIVLSFIFVFLFNTVGFAAVSGSKPRTSSPPKSTSTSTQTTTPASGYKPSTPANNLNDKAPAATQMNGQSRSGGFLRNMALLGGGMLLGGMLGSMFGFGADGLFATIIGMLFNLVLLLAIFKLGAYLWTRYKARRDKKFR